jgi:hypothetical protein
MFTCESNPNRNAALVELTTGGSTYKEYHHFVKVMTDCIEQWLYNPNVTPSATDAACPTLSTYKPQVLRFTITQGDAKAGYSAHVEERCCT